MSRESRSKLLSDFHGIMLIDKESGITSYDLIRKIKKVFF
jgi:tRNA U55 pseudouridine synthase TruB